MKQCAIILLFTILASINLPAQELLIGLEENASVPRVTATRQMAQPRASLELPFVDDFAKPTDQQPDSEKWLDNNVFINNSYAINPPTVGVATFDPFDSNGQIYEHANTVNFIADVLTSRPINLNYQLEDSLYISFYYQPQGYGDMPEAEDTLALQFYDKVEQQWITVWRASVDLKSNTVTEKQYDKTYKFQPANLGNEFYRVHLPIVHYQYFRSDFQFRFLNAASIVVNKNIVGRATGTDHWHIDYVYLDTNRRYNDLRLPDIAINQPQAPLSTAYESVPAIHMSAQNAINDMFADPMLMYLTYTNLGWGEKSVTRNFSITPLYGGGAPVEYSGGAENVSDGNIIPFVYQAPRYELNTTEDSVAFEIRSHLITDKATTPLRIDLRHNDTVRYIQRFSNYYAYDDGTAENGYGLFGSGTAAGQVAMRFLTYRTDSLRGVYLYFNRTVNGANELPFVITVWAEENGVPGEVLHSERVSAPAFNGMNTYVAYKFATPVALAKDQRFYVGWTQLQEAFMNIGYDRNRNHRDKIFYKIAGEWDQSVYEGSLMIRPIFTRTDADFPAEHVPPVVDPESTTAVKDFYLYPNPSNTGYVRVADTDTQMSPQNRLKTEIYDASGRLILREENDNGLVDVSSVPKGIYFMRVWENGKLRGTKRLVVN